MIDYGTMVFNINMYDGGRDRYDSIKTQLRNQLFTRDIFHYASILYECTRLANIIGCDDAEFHSHTLDYDYVAQFKISVGTHCLDDNLCHRNNKCYGFKHMGKASSRSRV